MEWLSPELLKIGASGLVTLFFLLVVFGLLVPKWQVKAQVAQAQKNAELWQKAAEANATRADLAVKQNDQLLAGMDTLESLIRALVSKDQRQG